MDNERYWFIPVFDDPPADPPADPPVDDPPADDPPTKGFTQQQVNDLIAKEKGKIQQRYDKRIKELETIRDSKNLSSEEVAQLNKQIEEMQSEFKTKEQLAIEEANKAKKTYEKDLSKAQEQATDWQNRYTNMVIKSAIVKASAVNEAFDADQIVALLQPNTRLADVLDEQGKKTGDLEPKTKFIGLDEESKEIELDISPSDAVKRMTQMDKYANLFKRAAVGGLGANNQNRGVGVLGDLKNTANYIAQRNKGKLDTSKKKG